MAIRAVSLEDYLKKYTTQKGRINAPKDVLDYAKSKGIDPERKYADAVREAMIERSSAGGYGASGEALGRIGLVSGGYREHLEQLAERSYDERLDAASEVRNDEYVRLSVGYQDYLAGYKDEQESIKSKLRLEFIESGIMDLESTYAIGLSRGLSPDEAASLSVEIYKGLRHRVFTEALAALSSARLDIDGVRAYAERCGLIGDDVAELVEEARRYAVEENKYSDEVLKRLEDMSDEDHAPDVFQPIPIIN